MSSLALELIRENKISQATFLDLGNCGLTSLPEELFECVWLKELELNNEEWDKGKREYIIKSSEGSKNYITELTDGIQKLINLKALNISGDKGNGSPASKQTISDVKNIGKLVNLKRLYADNIDLRDSQFLAGLTNLTQLSITNCSISNIDFLNSLKSLRFLILSENYIDNWQPISSLINLETLFISFCEVSDIAPLESLKSLKSLFFGFNRVVNISCLSKLVNLEELWFGYNQVADLNPLGKLKSLRMLHMYGNDVSDIDVLGSLPNLEDVRAYRNKISDINVLLKVRKLKYADITNNQVSKISLEFLEKISLDVDFVSSPNDEGNCVWLSGNPIEYPTSEVVKQGKIFTIEFLRNQNKKPLNECKVIIIGRGAVGKTSLQKRLFGSEPFNPKESETHGIRKRSWGSGIKDKNELPIKVHFWDFGGQHIQQTLHQFFYTDNTIYLLVLDKRKDENPEDFLELIRVYGNNSPVIIVYNNQINLKKHRVLRYDLKPELDSSLRNKYGNIKKIIGVCCGQDNDPGVNELRRYLETFIPETPLVQEKYPSHWLKIKDDLLTRVGNNYILFDEFEELCQQYNVNQIELQKGLAKMLTSVGAITFFERQFLGNYYVLNPDWVTVGAYEIILAQRTREKNGRINFHDLIDIFSKKLPFKYNQNEWLFLLNLMKEFDLCHEFSKNEWLIPSALQGVSKTNLIKFKEGNTRKYCIRYQLSLPESIIHRFIARNIKFAFNEDYWKNGIVVKHPETETIMYVESDRKDREIRLWIKGTRIRDCWEYFRKDFRDFSGKFLFDEMVAMDEEGEALVGYKMLMNLVSKPQIDLEKWYDPNLNIEINVLQTLGLFEDIEKNNKYKENIERLEKKYDERNININIPINNNNSGQQNVGSSNSITVPQAERKDNNVSEEKINSMVRWWKWKSLIILILSLLVTSFVIFASINEYAFIATSEGWKEFKSSDLAKWGGSVLGVLWNGFVIRMTYDRWFDPSKEKALRDTLKR